MHSDEIPASEEREGNQKSQRTFKETVKDYAGKSKVTTAVTCLVLVMFFISVVMSWTYSIEAGYGFLKTSPEVLLVLGGNVPVLVSKGQIYRLLTACLLHAGMLHWLLNSLTLVTFCGLIEPLFDSKLFILIFVVGGIQGNMLFAFINLAMDTLAVISVGASTCICAVMGLFVSNAILLHFKGAASSDLKKRVVMMLVSVLVISLVPGVDLFGHLGSLVSGLLLGFMFIPGDDRQLVKFKRVGIVVFTLYSIALGCLWFL